MSNQNNSINNSPANYGTMDGSATNVQNVSSPVSPKNTSGASGEPPKPAVRKRIQQSKGPKPNTNATTTTKPDTMNKPGPIDKRELAEMDYSKKRPSGIGQAKAANQSKSGNEFNRGNNDISSGGKLVISKDAIILPLPSDYNPSSSEVEAKSSKRPYPKKVLFIVANEFCERFSYYGMRTILVLYFKSVLGFNDANSTVSFHLFTTLCYLTPILGAILGDSVLGKFKTILYLSIVYFIGEFILVLSSILWDLNAISAGMTIIGLLLIGIGTGGIKPCVSAFGGDQFRANEEKWRENFFSLFYGAINLGSLVSMFLTPMLRSNYKCVNRSDCYPYAFGLPCALMLLAIIVFLLAHKHYVITPLPKNNVLVAFCKCFCLALKRKISGRKLPRKHMTGQINHSLTKTSSDSSVSVGSNEAALVQQKSGTQNVQLIGQDQRVTEPSKHEVALITDHAHPNPLVSTSERRKDDHWLYLASDQYDTKSIEEFRSVLSIILIFLPAPVYWCLFDQQGSLWTLQANRMDGSLFGSSMVLQPDQMSIFNPLLLLASIPLFQFIIYPSFNKCGLLKSPIQKMTVGGLLAALSFVASAMIEIHLQESMPNQRPTAGYANLLLINGLNDCSLVNSTISYVKIPDIPPAINITNTFHEADLFEPLGSHQFELLSANQPALNNYKFTFRLADNQMAHQNDFSSSPLSSNQTGRTLSELSPIGCPFDFQKENELSIGPLADQAVKMLYLEQGNGKLTYKLFNETLELPPAGKARVRLLYEFFGSYSQAEKRQFALSRKSNTAQENLRPHPELEFHFNVRDGQVMLSDYIDVDVSGVGDSFTLKSNDKSLSFETKNQAARQQLHISQPEAPIYLKPGTRNLIILHQQDATSVSIKQELFQDNNYRISMLYQLIPYALISLSEVMFSITGLEFSYSMAPETMKSVILGVWSLTTAIGNILTVAVESIHPFSNIAHDFLFYAALMAVDMLIFATIGYYFKPHKPETSSQEKATSEPQVNSALGPECAPPTP